MDTAITFRKLQSNFKDTTFRCGKFQVSYQYPNEEKSVKHSLGQTSILKTMLPPIGGKMHMDGI